MTPKTKKRIGWTFGLIILIGLGAAGYVYQKISSQVLSLTPDFIEEMSQEVAAQNESAIKKPSPRKRVVQPYNPLKNVYFGDTHVHTALSFDSYLFGNRFGLDDAYRFAQGDKLINYAGEALQLTEPLDFINIADHAESFGLFELCSQDDLREEQVEFCKKFDNPSLFFLFGLIEAAVKRPPNRPVELCGEDGSVCFEKGKTTWSTIQKAAEKYNKPGVFTAFSGYEYSPPIPDGGEVHRVVIFKSEKVPNSAVSAFEAPTEINLWQKLEETCTDDCQFLTIPHNMNQSWGYAYSRVDFDDNPYGEKDWALRRRSEPLVEIFQIKLSSECAIGVGAVDEECSFEQFWPICKEGESSKCVNRGSFAREGLKFGLELEKELGFNPLRFGFIGSTDTHNGAPGDTEEWDWRGFNGVYGAPVKNRMKGTLEKQGMISRNPGGLAAVWAVENTRSALFESMKKRETYATSGTRIRLRFFSGWGLEKGILDSPDLVSRAYEKGVPMGSVLGKREGISRPKFLVWAAKDPDDANLQRIQMIKGWIEDGKRMEEVFDIACSDGLNPDPTTGRCPDNGARVDVSTCGITTGSGDAEMKILWEDDNFNPDLSSFYYVRVLENPTCRWSTYDSIRLGQPPREDVPATIRERAWSSPIWYSPDK